MGSLFDVRGVAWEQPLAGVVLAKAELLPKIRPRPRTLGIAFFYLLVSPSGNVV